MTRQLDVFAWLRAEHKRQMRRHIEHLIERSESAERAYRVAIAQRLGATVIKRRERTWNLRRAELEEALSRTKRKAA